MLEKIGLPPKPSLRGNNWVVDATHCQGCSSQFTFINRKHHCRRCGGLFCNSCTQQRMLLRGQGNSPVRICEPCKKLEEAARFEMRHGHKNKAGRGGFNLVSKHEEELLNEIMNDDKRESVLSGRESVLSSVSNIQQGTSGASCSNIKETTNQDEGREFRSLSVDVQNHVLTEMGSATAEELRQEASDQKKKYKILKAQGKSEEALKAFKRGKELERQADALELHLRKNRRRTLSSNNVTELQKVKENSQELGRTTKLPLEKDKEKDNLASELKELGWSDMDLHASDKRSADMTLESELYTILGERSKKVKSTGKGSDSVEKSQVIAHKKKALALKREGKLAEAKEELKKAKVLEKKIEEQELLGDDEDSDEEFSALVHSMDIDKKDDLSISYDGVPSFDFNNVVGIPNDLDGNFEVTDEDMDDPELAATLKSLGWTEETAQSEDVDSHLNREALLGEIQSLKREAVYKKRAGNAAEAMEWLKKAKQLERDLDSSASQGTNSMTHVAGKTAKINSSDVGNANGRKDMAPSPEPKSKLIIQKELLGLKKRALALRREGRLDEADEELKKGMIFERQLEEMNNTSKREVSLWDGGSKNADDSTDLDVGDEGDMTDQEMCDPTYLSILESLGWKEEGNDSVPLPPYIETNGHVNDMKINNSSVSGGAVSGNQVLQSRSKSEIQRELLALKRKAIALRRQGKAEEAEEVLKLATLLETQLKEVEGPKRQAVPAKFSRQPELEITKFSLQNAIEEADERVLSDEDMHDPELISMLNNLGWKDEEAMKMQAKSSGQTSRNPVSSDDILLANFAQELPVATPKRSKMEIQRELLGLKRKALSLRRQGETEEAEEVLRMAKALEAQLEDVQVTNKQPLSDGSKQQERKIGSLSPDEKQGPLNDVVVGNEISVQATMEPNKAVDQPEGLGRESGKVKSLLKTSDISSPETSPPIEHNHQLLVDLGPPPQIRSTEGTGVISPSGQTAKIVDLLTGESWSSSQSDQNVEQKWDVSSVNSFNTDFHVPIDSQKACLVDFRNKDKVTNESEQHFVHASEKPSINDLNRLQVAASQNDGSSLQQDILAHKRKAVALKRQGKLAEAKEELRQAKALEKQLEKSNVQPIPSSSDVSSSNVAAGEQQQCGLSSAPKPLSSRDRFKLQQESLKHKRQALKLRREGRIQEAEAEFELAKSLETQLEDSSADKPVADVTVEDFLDPQLLSALKAIGLEDDSNVPHNTHKPVSVPETIAKVESSNEDRIQLEERIKEERVKAVNLKRLGKQAEALESLRQAKLFEKKLNSLIAK